MSRHNHLIYEMVRAAGLAFVVVSPASLAASTEPALVSCPRVATPPRIDGNLEDGAWDAASLMSNFLAPSTRGGFRARKQTGVWLIRDEDKLYFAFRCDDPHPKALASYTTGRDATALLEDDCVEIFLDPGGTHEKVLHAAFNANGGIYDEAMPGGPASWNPDWDLSIAIGKDCWVLEGSVTFREIGVAPKAGDQWGVNVCRRTPEGSEVCCWSLVKESPGEPGNFGRVVFPDAAPAVRFSQPGDEYGDLATGNRALVDVLNPTETSLELRLALRLARPDGKCDEVTREEVVPSKQSLSIPLPYSVGQIGAHTLTVLVSDSKGAVCFSSGPIPLKNRFLKPRLLVLRSALRGETLSVQKIPTSLSLARQLLGSLQATARELDRLSTSLRVVKGPSLERWLEFDRKVRRLERHLVADQMARAVLCSLSAEQLGGQTPPRTFVAWRVDPFETVLPDTVPSPLPARSLLEALATPGEVEPLSFAVTTISDLTNVSVRLTSLRCNKSVIPAEAVDVRVVRCWLQAGKGPFRTGASVLVPELLLKDDRVTLRGECPDLPETRDTATDLEANTSKQFWLTAHVPAKVGSGIYGGSAQLLQGDKVLFAVPIRLRVLPFRLARPRQQFVVHFRDKLTPERGTESPAGSLYVAQLKNIRDHGFSAASASDGTDELWMAVAARRKAGLSGPVPCLGPFGAADQIRRLLAKVREMPGAQLLFGPREEPIPSPELEVLRELLAPVRAAGGRAFAAATKEDADRLADVLDTPCYSVESPGFVSYVKGLATGQTLKNARTEWYYWQAGQEDARINRLLCGFYLWKSGLDGVFAYSYQQVMGGGNPFDETGALGAWRHRMLTYPSSRGPLDTIQWEAAREGIDDLRYATTLEKMLELASYLTAVKEDAPTMARARRALALVWSTVQLDPNLTLRTITPRRFNELRAEIIVATLDLLELLRQGLRQ